MTEPRMSGEKRCSCCGEEKPVLAFGVQKKSPDGLASWCRDCSNLVGSKSPSTKARRAEQRERKAQRAEKKWDLSHIGRPGTDW